MRWRQTGHLDTLCVVLVAKPRGNRAERLGLRDAGKPGDLQRGPGCARLVVQHGHVVALDLIELT